jgi:hypothetical protein
MRGLNSLSIKTGILGSGFMKIEDRITKVGHHKIRYVYVNEKNYLCADDIAYYLKTPTYLAGGQCGKDHTTKRHPDKRKNQ